MALLTKIRSYCAFKVTNKNPPQTAGAVVVSFTGYMPLPTPNQQC